MQDTLNFIRECKNFFFSTVQDGAPVSRPFGAIMLREGKFYFTTGRGGNVYAQITKNPSVCITSLLYNTRRWVRILGEAREQTEEALKIKMIEENPILEKRYSSYKDEKLVLIEVEPKKIDKNF